MAKGFVNFSPAALADPVPVCTTKCVKQLIYFGESMDIFSCVQGFKITFVLNKNGNSMFLQFRWACVCLVL